MRAASAILRICIYGLFLFNLLAFHPHLFSSSPALLLSSSLPLQAEDLVASHFPKKIAELSAFLKVKNSGLID